MSEYGLSDYDAGILTADKSLADLLEATVEAGAPAKSAANWLTSEFLRLLNESGQVPDQTALTPKGLAELVALQEKGAFDAPAAKKVFARLVETGASPAPSSKTSASARSATRAPSLPRWRKSSRRTRTRSKTTAMATKLDQIPRRPGDAKEQGTREPEMVNKLLEEKLK